MHIPNPPSRFDPNGGLEFYGLSTVTLDCNSVGVIMDLCMKSNKNY